MKTAASHALLLLLVAAAPAAAQTSTPASVPPEEIGSWRLSCITDRMTDRADCLLRHREPVERAQGAGGSSLVLEVQDRGGRLVPVVTARDLTLEAAGRGLLAVTGTAQLRFPPNRFYEMPCTLEGRTLACAPKPEDAGRAAEELAAATTALVRVTGLGAATTQAEPVELRLDRTRDALARYRARVPEGTAPQPQPSGLTLPEIIGRLQRLFGN
ncbi:hypothetical protein G3576_13460 [Roseomonas stagni]|uniref:Invasion associated locus B family protein n=1 Tax=Falsiroseomonas algicola TaxID=2716930 RepID=A0A6M1LL11_9PROT|nr:hypothetical protein [Falsiroseomonas algicola]NGM21026.1 hypothetical protein [Falsiroseomonas algicola]